eukprot:CAMPEP_0177650666 /NCGR_PEP_ID=MMETSP0447-20121125/12074_1 /TAXON_ID=0 /ORGANISM="Stygamoeba regulata, Strain BSH-02190019" /LENGTH=324 /DNA_ID=CAMNT_0019153571 /DNA_START=111 /DNA_END=1085 /DNA_ORIENTATION=+
MASVSSPLSGTVGDIIPAAGSALKTVKSTTTLPEALAVMGAHNIYAVPVVNPGTGVCEGLLSLSDIASFLVQQFWKESGVDSFAATCELSTEKMASHLATVKHSFDTQTSLATMNLCRSNAYCPVTKDVSLANAVRRLATGGSVSRLVVVSEDKKPLAMVTPADLVVAFNKRSEVLGAFGDVPVKDVCNVFDSILGIQGSHRVIDALALMVEHVIDSVGVTDDDTDEVITVMSVKDLREALIDFQKLIMPAEAMMKEVRQKNFKAIAPVISVKDSLSLSHVMQKLAVVRVHRVYVRDDNGGSSRYTGVLSLRDILRAINEHTKA